jgi:hypothetical protein
MDQVAASVLKHRAGDRTLAVGSPWNFTPSFVSLPYSALIFLVVKAVAGIPASKSALLMLANLICMKTSSGESGRETWLRLRKTPLWNKPDYLPK